MSEKIQIEATLLKELYEIALEYAAAFETDRAPFGAVSRNAYDIVDEVKALL